MKKYAVILASVFIILLLAGCSRMIFSKESQYAALSDTKEVSVSVKDGSICDTGFVLFIRNNTENELYYDMTYLLEKKKNNIWYSWDKEMAFTSMAAILKPKSGNEFQVTWDAKLSKGSYRVVKPVVTSEGVQYLGAEFTID